MEALLPVTALATTLISLRRTLPWQNIAAMTAIIAGFGYVIMVICVRTGLPFGPLIYLDEISDPLLEIVPWWVPALWVVLVINARGVARLMLYRWRTTRNYGLWVIGLTCLLVAAFDLGLEPFATRARHYWVWSTEKSAVNWNWHGAPVTSFLSWAICTFVVSVATVVWGINKRPAPVAPHHHPLAVWTMLNGLMIAGNVSAGLWLAAACSAGMIALTLMVSLWPGRNEVGRFRSLAFPSGADRGPQTRD